MSISLSKGSNISLTKEAPGLTSVAAGLGWDPRATTGYEFDLDASALGVDANGTVVSDQWFVFYGNLQSPEQQFSTPVTFATAAQTGTTK